MFIAIILILILSAAAGLFAAYHKVFYSSRRSDDETRLPLIIANKKYHDEIQRQAEILAQIPCEWVETRSRDGLRLVGRYYHHDSAAPLCICFHGYRGSAVRDFSVMGQVLQHDGNNVILVDERAHWRSGGHTITYGVKERYDVLSWVEYANERFGADVPIFLFGISMGAGTVLMASGLDLPDNVRGICADCPFSSPKDVICHVSDKIGLNPSLTWPVIRLSALVYGRLNLSKKITAANAVKHTEKPILIIHGESDNFVPAAMSEVIADANPAKVERCTFPGAEHGLSYFVDPDRYLTVVRDFMKRHM